MLVSRLAGWVALAQSQGEMEDLLVDLVRAGTARELLEELFPGGLAGLDEDLVRRLEPGRRLVPDGVRWSTALPRPIASNNWALGPSRTRSGRALLANDPHLEVGRLPAVWQEIGARAGDRWFIGATMPGLPGLLIGRTNDLAWGATYAFMDATDSWIEDCRDGRCLRRVDGRDTWVPVAERTETIRRRGDEPLTVRVFETDRGVLDGDPHVAGLRRATRWSAGRGAGARSVAAAIAMFRARDVREGMAAAGGIESAFNWVMADRHGSIGLQMSGLLPVRPSGASGLVPLPAWDPQTAWDGFAPPEDLPRVQDPPEGFIVTANHDLGHLGRVQPQNLPMGDSRARRIEELLRAREDWDVEGVAAVQLDEHSPQAARYLELLRPLLPAGANGDLLRAWDARFGPQSRAATLFERWYRGLIVEVVGGALGRDVALHLLEETGIVADFYANLDAILLSEHSAWFGGRTREEIYAKVALATLATPARTWGEHQHVTMRHLLFGGRFPAALGFDRGPYPLPGLPRDAAAGHGLPLRRPRDELCAVAAHRHGLRRRHAAHGARGRARATGGSPAGTRRAFPHGSRAGSPSAARPPERQAVGAHALARVASSPPEARSNRRKAISSFAVAASSCVCEASSSRSTRATLSAVRPKDRNVDSSRASRR